jgi:hypothetical protein
LFKGQDALLGTSWVDSVSSGWSMDSHHRLVISQGTVLVTKTRDMYGHFRTATQIQCIKGTYYMKDPTTSLVVAAKALDDVTMNAAKPLQQLCTNAIGGILLVTRIPASDGAPQTAFITVLGAASVATYAQNAVDAGLVHDNIWDESAIAALPETLISSDPNFPVLGAQEGYYHASTLPAHIMSLLQDTQPILLPPSQQLAQSLAIAGLSYQQAIFLPKVCNLPLGMRWSTSIGF